ncbi:SUMF1/EgtB/PvdO family nonheme iron enzyme [Chitinophaga arvensicola]|uniref:Sulfatase-modifying factor enzyme 1 n=1 Tax=Chitinophaga arvensicola TaxID=29529 RepID=A0A1I0SB75_9BACT|nr:SUMF1/EgtB/PvdO family nonheme iron enzyme [Chitinophaga arvensicola]SEW53731.1 Sulfatase-modifying factor enzyme 1 [Chitinophaga arvensicola]
MDVTRIYQRKDWNALSEKEATAILTFLTETQLPEFSIRSFERFSKFNQHTFTVVLDYKGSEFVFVPGDTVTLGLNEYPMTSANKEQLAALNGTTPTETDEWLQARLSPLRTVTIAPMIVERYAQETGYLPVSPDDGRLVSDKYFKQALNDLLNSSREKYAYTVNNSFRLNKDGQDITAFLYQPATYDELVADVANNGFRLPTEDEWEYLCGGGSRTIFPWGNEIDPTKKYRHFAADHHPDEPFFLDTFNHFGIVIANNPYHYEITMDSEWFLKAGDGGCNICGGSGLELGYLSAGTYYRDPYIFDEEMNYKEEIAGEYTYRRRLKRLL